jgi:hypothetical protein
MKCLQMPSTVAACTSSPMRSLQLLVATPHLLVAHMFMMLTVVQQSVSSSVMHCSSSKTVCKRMLEADTGRDGVVSSDIYGNYQECSHQQ